MGKRKSKNASARNRDKPLFLCYGAAGEICTRVFVRVITSKVSYVRVYGAPIKYNIGRAADHYVRAPKGTTVTELILRDESAGTESSWVLDDVTPLNEAAVKIVAKLKWDRNKGKFMELRKLHPRGSFRSLKELRSELANLEL